MVIYVFGHKNPDTDSIASSIVYSNFLNKKGIEAKPVKLGKINNETRFVLEKFGFNAPETIETLPENSEVILMDHNEKKQTISNIDELNIKKIIDHHKFNLQTEKPLSIRAEPWGSTCSIVFEILKQNSYGLSKEEAGILISGIISDTLYFRSPTTTKKDKEFAEKLNKIAEIDDLEKFSMEMFREKSNLGDINAEEIIKMDYKEFEFAGKKYGIGVIETTNPDYIFKRKQEIIDALSRIKKRDNLKGILFSVIDILNEENKTIVSDSHEAEILKAVFDGKEIEHKVYYLGPIISRKKQIVPKLEKYFQEK